MIALTVEQERELRRYENGQPRRPAQRPNRNLIRRDLLTLASGQGPGWYRITPLGLAALAEREPASYAIDADALYPRDDENRYRLYARRGGDLEVLCTTDTAGGIGVALVQFDADEREMGGTLADRGAFGVLDAIEGRWLVLPWHRTREQETL